MPNRFKYTVEIEIDRDMIPGFGHDPESWANFITRALDDTIMQNKHYNPSVEIVRAQISNGKDSHFYDFVHLNDEKLRDFDRDNLPWSEGESK